ncbi:hypothetical protein D3C81_1864490 [compost metagenome]
MEHAIDAGIIKSGIVTDAQAGVVQLEASSLASATREVFRESLGLSGSLENPVMKDSTFELTLHYDENEVPWIDVMFTTHVSFVMPGVSYPVRVHRNIPYESTYL